jgi:uncharacterized protein
MRRMERALTEYQWFKDLAAMPFVDALWLFGSRARGYASPRSDIDIAVLCPRATPGDWHRVLDTVEASDTLLKIDAIRFDELREGDSFRAEILRTRIPVFAR